MRILWITNLPIAHHKQMLNIGTAQSGGWMEAAFESLKDSTELQLGVATVHHSKGLLKLLTERHSFYIIPRKDNQAIYDSDDSFNQEQWTNVIADFHPDVIHIWGTENAYGLCALKVAKNIPSVVYIQGVMHEIYKHFLDGIDYQTQKKYLSFHERIRNNGSWLNKSYYENAVCIEKEMLQLSKNVIVESEWCAEHCSAISDGCRIHYSLLPVNNGFAEQSWIWNTATPHTIFTVAGGYPIKGHHVLFKAFSYVIKKYPDAQLRIPGDYSFLQLPWYRISSYGKYLNEMIKDLKIDNNIVFLGKLSSDKMAGELRKANVYVMPSNIENHSSSLIEAMMVGTPSVSAFVGGISQYYRDGENGLFYRQDDEEALASKIIRLFEDKALAERISSTAQRESRTARQTIDLKNDFLTIYKELIGC